MVHIYIHISCLVDKKRIIMPFKCQFCAFTIASSDRCVTRLTIKERSDVLKIIHLP